ncbi:hypothetical protein [Streptomyces cadmiisoli]
MYGDDRREEPQSTRSYEEYCAIWSTLRATYQFCELECWARGVR